MELRRYLHLLWRRILVLALAVVIGLAGGYLATNRTPIYQGEAAIYVGSRQFAAVGNSNDASAAMDRMIQTFATMIKSNAVATAAIQTTNVPRSSAEVASATSSVVVPNTNYIGVFVTDTDPVIAESLANGVAQGFVTLVQSIEPGTAGGAGTPAVTSVFQHATRPTAPLPTGTRRNLALGGLAGLATGISLVALLNYLDVSVKNPEDLEQIPHLRVLGAIPVLSTLSQRPAFGTGPPTSVGTSPGP